MYAVTSMPLESRTRATLRSAEFGFFGVMVFTTVQTPRFWGQPCMAGCFGFDFCGTRGVRINWLIVGIQKNLNGKAHTSPRIRGFSYSSESDPHLPVGRTSFFAKHPQDSREASELGGI
jgi:hypothetical protein